ncbi:MAG: hypothetical protein ACJ8KX_12010 [Chthoniobacterales bacterium]
MKRTFLICFAILLILPLAHGGEVEIPAAKKEKFSFKSPEQYRPLREPFTPPMFGDQFQFGFNFNGGFNFNFGSQGGFNFQFGGQFNQGGFNFGGQFNGGGFQFGAPIAPLRGAYKIAENESPRPTDRVYFQYNFYSNLLGENSDLHRETLGVEKTFFSPNFSLGLRLPFGQLQTDFGDASDVLDLTVVLKYALYHNRTTGNVFSVGLAITPPSGEVPTAFRLDHDFVLHEVHPTQLQPFVGYIWNSGPFFVQGFSAVLIPTDGADVTVWLNDLGVGYRIPVGARWLATVVPVLELHLNTPLDHRDEDPFEQRFRDTLDLTGGVHFEFNDHVSLGIGLGTPLTSPRLFDYEVIANLNVRF